jgi:hypothetical protein
MKPQSKSKTFPKGTAFVDILNWVDEEITCEIKEVPYCGSEPSVDHVDATTGKYLITIVKYNPEKEEK